MTRPHIPLVLLVSLCLCTVCPHAVAKGGGRRAGAGIRNHVLHSTFDEIPYGDDDISYSVCYESHEAQVYWQFALAYCPDLTGTNTVDTALTPQVSVILKDKFLRGGMGVAMSRLSGDEKDWSDLFWELILGVHIDLSNRLGLDVLGSYRFAEFGDIGDFDVDDVELGGWLTFTF